jgi:cytochrome c biogenesis protein CcdA
VRGTLPSLLFAAVAIATAAGAAHADPPVARVLLFTSSRCPHCLEVRRHVVPALRERFGSQLDLRDWDIGDPDRYEALMAIEDAHGVPLAERVVPVAVIGDRLLNGVEPIARELPGLIQASLASGGTDWPAQATVVERPPRAAEGPDGGPPIWMAFFHQTGCQECSRVRADLDWLVARHPRVRVEEHNVYDEAPLGMWLARRAGRELETPSVFVADEALVGADELHPRALEGLVERHAAEGAPRVWDGMAEEEARDQLIARFRSFGPLAVVVAGLVDGINPCAFATLIFFVSYLSASRRRGRQVLAVGGAFTVGVFLAYLLVGLGLYRVLDRLGTVLPTLGRVVLVATALLCLALAVLSFRDFLLVRRGGLGDMALKLPEALQTRIRGVIRRGRRARYFVAAAFVTGIVVSILELACTGQVYLPTIIFVTTVPELRGAAIGYLVLYNLLFVLPLVVVFGLVYVGTTSQQLVRWLEGHAQQVKLGLAALFLLLALWLLAAAVPAAPL